MGANSTYDPAKVIASWGGVPITGIADGTFLLAERNNPMWTTQTGSDGESCRSKSNDKSGKITVTLNQWSTTNDALSLATQIDEATNASALPFEIKDLNGTTLVYAEQAWPEKPANAEFGREAGSREWVFQTGKLEMFVGGN